jgi:hypothetical protein
MADSLSAGIQNHCVAPTIADDHPMASIELEASTLELQDHIQNRLQAGGLIPRFFHGESLLILWLVKVSGLLMAQERVLNSVIR